MLRSVGPFYMQGRQAGYHKKGMLSRADNREVVMKKALIWLKEYREICEFLEKYIRAVDRRAIR